MRKSQQADPPTVQPMVEGHVYSDAISQLITVAGECGRLLAAGDNLSKVLDEIVEAMSPLGFDDPMATKILNALWLWELEAKSVRKGQGERHPCL